MRKKFGVHLLVHVQRVTNLLFFPMFRSISISRIMIHRITYSTAKQNIQPSEQSSRSAKFSSISCNAVLVLIHPSP